MGGIVHYNGSSRFHAWTDLTKQIKLKKRLVTNQISVFIRNDFCELFNDPLHVSKFSPEIHLRNQFTLSSQKLYKITQSHLSVSLCIEQMFGLCFLKLHVNSAIIITETHLSKLLTMLVEYEFKLWAGVLTRFYKYKLCALPHQLLVDVEH